MVRARAPGTGPWLQERVGGGVGAGWQFQRRGRVEAWLAVQKSGGPRLGLGFGCGGVGGRGTAPELVWWTGGVDQGPWLVWAGRRGWMAVRKPKNGKGARGP